MTATGFGARSPDEVTSLAARPVIAYKYDIVRSRGKPFSPH